MAKIIKVEGLGELKKTLQGLPIHLRKKVMYRLLRKAAAPMLRAVKANVPVAKKATPRVIPGLIKRMMRISVSKFKKPARGEFGIYIKPVVPGKIKSLKRAASRGGVRGPDFGDPYYYKFQEFGFLAVGRSKAVGGMRARAERQASWTGRRVPGKGFMWHAFESGKGTALNMITSDLAKEIAAKFERKGR